MIDKRGLKCYLIVEVDSDNKKLLVDFKLAVRTDLPQKGRKNFKTKGDKNE